ncbi:MAG: hypothetical protein K8F25_15020 [Fimbriimonadaceae bacterium]|nr:hypothetical protein [Alphaproteobacteria bacterium]
MKHYLRCFLLCAALIGLFSSAIKADDLRGTGDLGLIVERASGAVTIVETSGRSILGRVEGLGDLSHASAVYSRDQRYAYIFGRDGGLNKIDMLTVQLVKRVIQAGNAIGGAISDDGKLIAVSNYDPGGVRIFNAETLEPIAEIPANYGSAGLRSKVVGLVDAPGRKFVFTLYDGGEIWMADCDDCLDGGAPLVTKIGAAGEQPYDGLITGDGRIYIAGLFGEDGMAMVDLWAETPAVRRILDHYGRGELKLPVYKMPHLEGWAQADGKFFLPAVGRHEVLVVDGATFAEVGRIPVYGQPVFVMARPDGRQVWVNFAHPNNDTIQVIDVPSQKIVHQFTPGRAALHMEFTPRGEEVWISVRDKGQVEIYDTQNFELLGSLAIESPSGIFFTSRANRIGL